MIALARDIAADVQGGRLDPLAVTRDALAQCHASQATLNALTLIDDAKALAEAATIPARLAAGEKLPLAGVPIIVKDNIWVGGWRITQGSRFFADHIAPRDALAVERARKAGAVVLGIGIARNSPARASRDRHSMARRDTPWTRTSRPAAHPAGTARLSLRAWFPSPSARMAAARAAGRPRIAGSWGSSRAMAPSRIPSASRNRSGGSPASRPSRAMWPMPPCSSP